MLRPRCTGRGLCYTVVLVACVFPGVLHAADSSEVAELKAQLDESRKSLEQLAAKVRELESRVEAMQSAAPTGVTPTNAAQTGTGPAGAGTAGAAAATPAPSTPGTEAERLAALEREIAAITAADAARYDDRGAALHGFADVGAGTRDPINPDLHGAALGSLDFYLTPELGERTRALFELNFKTSTSGALVTALERAQLGYQVTEGATLWLGRFHTPYGYYNTAFHHGQQISTSLRRPKVVEFETTGGVLPAHTTGLWLAGANRVPTGRLTYDIYIGNAQRIDNGLIDTNNAGNPHGDGILGGSISFLPLAIDGFRIGVSAFTAKVEDDLAPRNLTHVNTYGLYVVYDTDRWENIAEFYAFDNKDLSGGTGRHRSEMGFVQLAYRTGLWTPYARYERADLDQTDNYFAAQRFGSSYYRSALGLRFDLDLASALKLELARTHITDRAVDRFDEALMQYAIRF